MEISLGAEAGHKSQELNLIGQGNPRRYLMFYFFIFYSFRSFTLGWETFETKGMCFSTLSPSKAEVSTACPIVSKLVPIAENLFENVCQSKLPFE